jgi:ABC-type branched-subunit amino acid transport system permease subunit
MLAMLFVLLLGGSPAPCSATAPVSNAVGSIAAFTPVSPFPAVPCAISDAPAPAAPAPTVPADEDDAAIAPLPSPTVDDALTPLDVPALAVEQPAPAADVEQPAPVTAPALAAAPLSRRGHAASPPAAIVLSLVAFVALLGTRLTTPNLRAGRAIRVRGVHASSGWWRLGGAAVVAAVPLLLAETTVYKLGLVLIMVVGAIGLHLLVNWAGELSLAHAPLIGLPAFTVAKLSADHHLSPIALLPLAVAVGIAAGAVIGAPAIRARGLQVALVTLAAGVAIDRFFFTKAWLVGDVSGAHVSTPTLGPVELRTALSLYPVLIACVAIAVGGAWAVYRSKVGRALLWIKSQPDAAAAFGVPVARYRTLAYALAGAYAGFAGGLTAMWVQRLTPAAFPLSLSFTYLIVAALAGRGFVGGVAAAAAVGVGGRLFIASGDAFITYAAPLGLILTLTRHPVGLNGLGRQLKERVMKLSVVGKPLITAGAVAIAVGFAAIGLAWYHAGNTSQVWIQNQELVSGGIGGLALVILGVGLVLADRLTELAKR